MIGVVDVNDLEGLTTNPIMYEKFVIEMILTTTVSTSSDMVAMHRYQMLNLDLTDRAVLSMTRANSNGQSGSQCWMPVADSIGRPSANTMLGVL